MLVQQEVRAWNNSRTTKSPASPTIVSSLVGRFTDGTWKIGSKPSDRCSNRACSWLPRADAAEARRTVRTRRVRPAPRPGQAGERPGSSRVDYDSSLERTDGNQRESGESSHVSSRWGPSRSCRTARRSAPRGAPCHAHQSSRGPRPMAGGPAEEISNFLVGGFRNVLVQLTHGCEASGDDGTDDLVGHHDASGALDAQRQHSGAHRGAGGQALVDHDAGLPAAVERRTIAAGGALTALELPPLAGLHAFDHGVRQSEVVHHALADDPYASGCDGAHGEFLVDGDAELPHDGNVEGRPEPLRDLESDRDAAARQTEDHNVGAAGVVDEQLRQPLTGVRSVLETRDHSGERPRRTPVRRRETFDASAWPLNGSGPPGLEGPGGAARSPPTGSAPRVGGRASSC